MNANEFESIDSNSLENATGGYWRGRGRWMRHEMRELRAMRAAMWGSPFAYPASGYSYMVSGPNGTFSYSSGY
jgi:hypothetical protein